jgi:hypothetical protein
VKKAKASESFKGPAAVEEELSSFHTHLKDRARQTTKGDDRKKLEEEIDILNIALCDLRTKRKRPKIYHELDKLTAIERTMAHLAKDVGRGRDVVYHGTRHLPAVLKSGKLTPGL